ncbi:MAG TPA: M1 family metallopeptidase [Pyrinomonadaceae bacterium]|jgi:aminopeptidase N
MMLSIFLLLLSFFSTATTQERVAAAPFDVSHYDAAIELDFDAQTIKATLEIQFTSRQNELREIELDASGLTFDGVWDGAVSQVFEAKDAKLLVRLSRPVSTGETRTLKIDYHAKPTRGVRFFPNHVYAAYNTSRWLPNHFHPGDKATFFLRLTAPSGMKVVANGRLAAQKMLDGGRRTEHAWQQTTPIPPYIFGFAAGRFQELVRRSGIVELRALSLSYTPQQMSKIFPDTHDIIKYFERRAGAAFPGANYAQVLAAGTVEQEMSGFTVIRETYAREVLADERDNWLVVHELAHEWWGNSLTCADWSHFWLNEGIATFIADAYQGERFGRAEYEREIELSRRVYARLRVAGRDRPLAYRESIKESAAGGLIVYDKGALVLHLLRFQIGEDAFWRGLRRYTREHIGGSVTTDDLQTAMERESGQNLSEFFEHWIYRADVPDISAKHRTEKGEVVIEIEQRQDKLWPIPLNVGIETTGGGRKRTTHKVLLRERRQELRFPVSGLLRSLRLDDGAHLPVRIAHERSILMLLQQLAHEPDVSGRLDALEQLQAKCGGADKTKAEPACTGFGNALRERASKDASRLVRATAEEVLKKRQP